MADRDDNAAGQELHIDRTEMLKVIEQMISYSTECSADAVLCSRACQEICNALKEVQPLFLVLKHTNLTVAQGNSLVESLSEMASSLADVTVCVDLCRDRLWKFHLLQHSDSFTSRLQDATKKTGDALYEFASTRIKMEPGFPVHLFSDVLTAAAKAATKLKKVDVNLDPNDARLKEMVNTGCDEVVSGASDHALDIILQGRHGYWRSVQSMSQLSLNDSSNGQQTSRGREGTSSGRPANDGEMRLEATRPMLESIRTTQDNGNSFAPSVLSPRSFAEVASPTGSAEPSSLPETSDSANNTSKALDDAPAEKSGKDTVSYGTPDRPFGTRRRRSSMNDEPPPEFLCPITCELMADPVMVVTGQTYERSSIRQWISEGHRTCPITRMPLGNIELVPNYALRNAIRAWAQKRGIELKEPEFFPPPRISGAQYKTANNASAPSQIPTWDNALPDRRSPPMLAVTQLFVGSSADKDAAVAQLATTASEDGENGRVSVVQAGAIPPLIMVLLEGSDFAKETAARCIRFLSRSNNPIITQGSAGAIPALVRLLSVGSQAAKEAACGALVNLSAKTDVNKFQIAVAGGITPLVSLLDFNQPNASRTSYECASAALCNLAFDNENRLKIAAAGAIPLLVEVAARSPTPEAGEYATHALGSLACEINENGEKIVQAGAVPVLLAALQNGSPWSKEAAARTLHQMLEECTQNRNLLMEALAHLGKVAAVLEGQLGCT
ncbi:unnamed protein product [Closterium sp. Yama58-4]|nr:unnamed protein product [Closterium sp. Yama58-4]